MATGPSLLLSVKTEPSVKLELLETTCGPSLPIWNEQLHCGKQSVTLPTRARRVCLRVRVNPCLSFGSHHTDGLSLRLSLTEQKWSQHEDPTWVTGSKDKRSRICLKQLLLSASFWVRRRALTVATASYVGLFVHTVCSAVNIHYWCSNQSPWLVMEKITHVRHH